METIITEIAREFIKKICEKLGNGRNFSEIEQEMLEDSKKCAAELTKAYITQLDMAIAADKAGYIVERRGDERRLQTQLGEVTYQRTYYKKAADGYEYLTDTVLGINSRERVSEGLSLANAAKDMSYGKASSHLTEGVISRQTVMSRVRRSKAAVTPPAKKRCVPKLHIDADEAHVTLCGDKRSEVPLISVYEGIEQHGKRNKCKNVFHVSEYYNL